MRWTKLIWPSLAGTLFLTALFAVELPRPFRVYISVEPRDNVPVPPDYQEKTEWVFGRLMYPTHPEGIFGPRGRFGGGFRGNFDWREGGTSWTQDYPERTASSCQRCAGSREFMPARRNSL